uniref:Uncharacterized protein n=1 Tax=Cacopsylla melanoneura TaxID=428564 RepID=A0A8D8WT59_9HEMI
MFVDPLHLFIGFEFALLDTNEIALPLVAAKLLGFVPPSVFESLGDIEGLESLVATQLEFLSPSVFEFSSPGNIEKRLESFVATQLEFLPSNVEFSLPKKLAVAEFSHLSVVVNELEQCVPLLNIEVVAIFALLPALEVGNRTVGFAQLDVGITFELMLKDVVDLVLEDVIALLGGDIFLLYDDVIDLLLAQDGDGIEYDVLL